MCCTKEKKIATEEGDKHEHYNGMDMRNTQTRQYQVYPLVATNCSRNMVGRGFLAWNIVETPAWLLVGRGFLARKVVPTKSWEEVPSSRNPPGPSFRLLPNGPPGPQNLAKAPLESGDPVWWD